MAYEFLEDGVTADVTFHAWGSDLNALFRAAADATFSVMVAELDSIEPRVTRPFMVEAEALDLLLFAFLNELIFLKDTHGLLLRAQVRVEAVGQGYRALGDWSGEAIDRTRHELLADVKAVTLYGLRVERRGAEWHAEVTLDV
jgi:SHS2 domain-containing protein